jgi:NAD(P)-dependent dehydrogenase (short-subunit alcohol dehydrogenase family)
LFGGFIPAHFKIHHSHGTIHTLDLVPRDRCVRVVRRADSRTHTRAHVDEATLHTRSQDRKAVMMMRSFARRLSTGATSSLAGKVAVVTGAGTGIGRETSLALAGAGASVVLAGRRAEPLAETAALIKSQGGPTALAVPTDLTSPEAIGELFAAVEKEHGRLDLLFNNAGTGAPAVPIDELPLEKWMTSVDTNLTAAFICTQHAFRIMKKQQPMGGRIINNGSVSADRPRPNSAPYTATKHAITGLTKSCALDGRPFKIACGQIDIGNADTVLLAGMKGSANPEPTMDVADVGRAIVYMASLPLEANVLFMTVMATNMPLIGRG